MRDEIDYEMVEAFERAEYHYEKQLDQLKSQLEQKCVELALDAFNTVMNNGAKASDERWDVIRNTITKIKSLREG